MDNTPLGPGNLTGQAAPSCACVACEAGLRFDPPARRLRPYRAEPERRPRRSTAPYGAFPPARRRSPPRAAMPVRCEPTAPICRVLVSRSGPDRSHAAESPIDREGSRMRIGLTGAGTTADRIVEQAQASRGGWFHQHVVPRARPAAATRCWPWRWRGGPPSAIELGTAVLVSYACHPVLQASRANAVASAIGTPGRFTLGIGPSHRVVVDGPAGPVLRHAGTAHRRSTSRSSTGLLRGEQVSFAGQRVPGRGRAAPARRRSGGPGPGRGAGTPAAADQPAPARPGTILWMANALAIESHVWPRISQAAADGGTAGALDCGWHSRRSPRRR